MACSGKDFYSFASDLYIKLDDCYCESQVRTIINRSYYGAFLEARNYLGHSENEKEAIHTKVGNELQKYDNATGRRFWNLFRQRKIADYKPSGTCSKKDAGESLRLAKSIIDKIS